MKKIFSIILIIAAMIAADSCSTASKVSNNPYEAEGYGVSTDRDIAYDKAYHSAVVKIAEKANVVVVADSYREYNSNEAALRNGNESLVFSETSTAKSKVNASDLVIDAKYRKSRSGWVCTVVVKVSPDNLY